MATTATVKQFTDQLPRDSMQRATAALANANTLVTLNRALTAAGAARGTTAAKAKTVNTTTFTIGGVFFSKAATDDFWTLAGTVVAASSWQKYLLLIDAALAASIQEGTQSLIAAANVGWANVSAGSWGPLITVLQAGKTIVATLTIATDATHTFTPGTTALNAAGITATFVDGYDVSLMPVIGNSQGAIIGTSV